ncbi:HvfC/BufC N-terminal domain-containing protein [Roseibium suaedae]|uniref:Putative DNA-binding domain-containing protein n=1 Tax=Roseibium suaedae TaxID=735517 RepID=A0A1M7IXC6_9HYPH|nr:DNA-binding domain-containing protein [Roseibium suaedae]SHM45325.1 Putative DNA-binding domain-containing protein [Roseibium suaedae]
MRFDPPGSAVAALEAFAPALLEGERDLPDGIIGPDGKPSPRRFNVYRNNVVVSLVEAVMDSYPAVLKLLGEDYFKAVARLFVINNPPKSPVLIWYGAAFAEFLESFPPLAAYGYLPDVARLEWAWLEAYHAADAAPLQPQTLASVPGDLLAGLKIAPHPSCRWLQSPWPVVSLLAVNRFESGEVVDLAEAQEVLVTRPDLDVEVRLMRPGCACLLEALSAGCSLSEAGERAAQSVQEDVFQFDMCLSDLLAAGALAAFDPEEAAAGFLSGGSNGIPD